MPHLVVGTAGHIDHGKSALVQALTGTDPDRLKEEKARGITIDLGFAHWQAGDLTVAFVDVPGHERFVKNMLAGAGGIDAVLLVVAADEGVMPQTREHFQICRLLGLTRAVVAITKADLADQTLIDLVALDVEGLLEGSAMAGSPMVPVSARTGAGLDALRTALTALARDARPHDADGAARLPIDRAFSMRGFGTVVTGTLARGTLRLDEDLRVLPAGPPVKVRGLQVHGRSVERAAAGQRVAVNLAGVDVHAMARGLVLASPGSLVITRTIDVRLELLAHAAPLRHGARVRFHQGTAEVLARVSLVAISGPDGTVAPLAPGAHGDVRLRLERPAALTRGDRFVLRSYSPSATMAGGWILDPAAPSGGVRLAATQARFAVLARPPASDGRDEDALMVFVAEAGPRGVTLGELAARMGTHPAGVGEMVTHLTASGQAWAAADRVVAAPWQHTLASRVLAALRAHHDQQPLSDGLPREEVRERVLLGADAKVADAVLAGLEAEGRIRGRERLAVAGHAVSLSSDEARAHEAIAQLYLDAGMQSSDLPQVATRAGLPLPLVERVAQLLVRQKVLVRLDTLLFHRDTLERLKQEIADLKARDAAARVDVASFKERYGLTRKYAIPLLEYLDRERVTRRVGDVRVIL
jgi:selenocysteine-specific elongation factor